MHETRISSRMHGTINMCERFAGFTKCGDEGGKPHDMRINKHIRTRKVCLPNAKSAFCVCCGVNASQDIKSMLDKIDTHASARTFYPKCSVVLFSSCSCDSTAHSQRDTLTDVQITRRPERAAERNSRT